MRTTRGIWRVSGKYFVLAPDGVEVCSPGISSPTGARDTSTLALSLIEKQLCRETEGISTLQMTHLFPW